MGDLYLTKDDKLIGNTGSGVDHVEGILRDFAGNRIYVTIHGTCIEAKDEKGHCRTVPLEALGLAPLKGAPEEIPDDSPHMIKTQRLLRIMFRLWSPKDRQIEAAFNRVAHRMTEPDITKLTETAFLLARKKVNSRLALLDQWVEATMDSWFRPHDEKRREPAVKGWCGETAGAIPLSDPRRERRMAGNLQLYPAM